MLQSFLTHAALPVIALSVKSNTFYTITTIMQLFNHPIQLTLIHLQPLSLVFTPAQLLSAIPKACQSAFSPLRFVPSKLKSEKGSTKCEWVTISMCAGVCIYFCMYFSLVCSADRLCCCDWWISQARYWCRIILHSMAAVMYRSVKWEEKGRKG